MAENSSIEWTDHTFNPWIGCTKVSPGCDHCYAEARMDARLHRVSWGTGQPRQRTKTWGDPIRWNKAHEAFYAAHGRRQRVFCASLADVFDNEVPTEWRRDLFDLIELTPELDWLLLTKRIGNVSDMVREAKSWDWLLGRRNVWLGATIVHQEEADRDIPKLLATPARVWFLSMEPLLGPVSLENIRTPLGADPESYIEGNVLVRKSELDRGKPRAAIDWVIVGGESGPHARPMHPDWARSLRGQCAAAGVPFFMKQMGGTRDKRGALDDLPSELRAREFPA
jgi:protein gp37